MGFLHDCRTHPAFIQGRNDMLALSPGIAAWGLMTGVAMVKSGMATSSALCMALFVYAGSAQLAAVPLMLAGAPLWVVLLTAVCVNLRFVVFSLHLRPYVMHLRLRQRVFIGYLTGDLTYVLFVKHFVAPASDATGRQAQIAYLVANGATNWATWMSFSVVGIVLANFIPTQWGLGFAGILALLGLLCSLASTRLRWLSAVVAGLAAVVAYALPLKLNILASIVVAVALCLLAEKLLLKSLPVTDAKAPHP